LEDERTRWKHVDVKSIALSIIYMIIEPKLKYAHTFAVGQVSSWISS